MGASSLLRTLTASSVHTRRTVTRRPPLLSDYPRQTQDRKMNPKNLLHTQPPPSLGIRVVPRVHPRDLVTVTLGLNRQAGCSLSYLKSKILGFLTRLLYWSVTPLSEFDSTVFVVQHHRLQCRRRGPGSCCRRWCGTKCWRYRRGAEYWW